MNNTQNQNSPQRTAQEILEARKRYIARPEGKISGAHFLVRVARADAKEQRDRADQSKLEAAQLAGEKARIETEVETLKNRFGLPHNQEDFSPRELYEVAQKNGYEAKKRAFLDALAKRETGEGVRLSFAEAEEFLSVLLSNQRRKRTP